MTEINATSLGVHALAMGVFTQLRVLTLIENHITDKGLDYICESPIFAHLTRLFLNNTHITLNGIKKLIQADFFTI